MSNYKTLRLHPLCLALTALATPALAAQPTSGAYTTDATQSYVHDATSEGIRLPNMVLCYMNGTGGNLTEVVNDGAYIALVDKNKCENSGSSGNSASDSSGATSAPDYLTGIVNATRVDNNSPLVGNVWFQENDMETPGGGSTTGIIYAHLSATADASDTSPYGVFHTDFCGLPSGSTTCGALGSFTGYAEGNGAQVSAYQSGGQDVSVTLTGNITSGDGRVKFSEQMGPGQTKTGDWKFSYNAGYFRRANNGDGSNDQCFDRSAANAERTAWSYGVYDSTGARLDRSSGFPIKTAAGDYGYVGYWGLWIQDGVILADGATVTRFSYSNNQQSAGTYTLVKKDGRLKKLHLNSSTLAGIANVPFFIWVNQTFTDSGSVTRNQGSNLEVKWDGSAFQITGTASNGPVTPDAACATACNTIPGTVLQTMWNINGWSQSLGGQVTVMTRDNMGTYTAPSNGSAVTYRTETVLTPGGSGWPGTLYCVSDCPAGGATFTAGLDNTGDMTAAYVNVSVTNWSGGTSSQSSRWNWAPVLTATVPSYVPDNSSGLLTGGDGSVGWTSVTAPANQQFSNGFQSGRMVDAAGLASLACDGTGGSGGSADYSCPNKLDGIADVYVFETGANSWNKFSGLMSGSTPVVFDPPLALSYTVPATGVSADYAGSTLVLQYNGFGDLHGIPGKCVDPVTNAEVMCNQNTRWVAAFAIPAGGEVTNGGTTYYVKPLQEELRLAKVNASNCASLTLPTIADGSLPGVSGWSDPKVANGTMPDVTTAPRVIHGVLQY